MSCKGCAKTSSQSVCPVPRRIANGNLTERIMYHAVSRAIDHDKRSKC